MNREQYIAILEVDNAELRKEKEQLIEYLENKINDIKMNYSQINGNYFNMNYTIEAYEDVLEKVRSGKYE